MAKSKVKGKKPAGYDSFKNKTPYEVTQLGHGPEKDGFKHGNVVSVYQNLAEMCAYIKAYREEGKPLPENLFTKTKAQTHTRGNER